MKTMCRLWFWIAGTLLTLAGMAYCQGYTVNVGDILVANYNAGSIVKIDPVTGVHERLGGNFSIPTDLVMDPKGNLYVSEWGGAIKQLELATGKVTTLMPSGSGPSQVWGIALGPTGDLFITSRGNHALYRVNPSTGNPTLVTQGNQLYTPAGIDFLDTNHLVVACLFTNRLVSVSLIDNSQSVIVEGGSMDQPWGVAVSGSDIYVAGYDGKVLQRVTGGTVTTIAPMDDFPYGIDMDAAGNPVIGLAGVGESVVRVSPSGTVLRTFTGSLIRWVTGIEVSTIQVSGGTASTIATSASPSTGGTTSGDGTYTNGATVIVSATANSGYAFVNWAENGTPVSTVAAYSFEATTNRTLVANFTNSIPQLEIWLNSSSNVVVAWPWPSADYVLQFNTDITTTNWANSTNAVSVSDGKNQVVITLPAGNCYYRLFRP